MKTFKSTVALILILSFSLSTIVVPSVLCAEDSWETMADMPTARSRLGVAVVDEKIYAIGGYLSGQINVTGHVGTNEMYDPATDTWATKESMPTARNSWGIAVCQNKIYVIGGETDEGYTRANEVYDPLTDTWETKTPMPTSRTYVVANEVNGKIYVMAGCTFPHPSFPTLCNKTEVYDPITDSWTEKAQMPDFTGLGIGENVASAVIGNTIYVLVGETLHIYTPENDSWNLGASISTKIYGSPAMGSTTGEMAPKRIYVLGDASRNLNQVYDPETDTWTNATSMPTPRQSLGVAVVNDILYTIGGGFFAELGIFTASNKNEKYTPSGYIPEFPAWTPILFVLSIVAVAVLIYRRKLSKVPAN
jgi:N-acetylneuraminic acid mutarotase